MRNKNCWNSWSLKREIKIGKIQNKILDFPALNFLVYNMENLKIVFVILYLVLLYLYTLCASNKLQMLKMGTQYKYCNRNLSLFTNVSWQIAEHQRDSISAWSDFLWLGWVNKGQSGRLFSGKEWLLCQALNLILYSSITYDGGLLSSSLAWFI